MDTFIKFILNPALISVVLLCILCLRKINVLLAIIISTLCAGLISGMDVREVMNVFISGMGGNSETALSYILLGAFAATMAHSGFTDVISNKIAKFVADRKYVLLGILTLIAMASQNLIPIHIAFIPIIIPPLLSIMNKLDIDRRAVACVLAFGLKMPYIAIPAGFGLIFQNLIADNMVQNGVHVLRSDIWKFNSILGLGMVAGLLIAVFISYRKPRIYENKPIANSDLQTAEFRPKHWIVILAALATFIVQLLTQSLPLGALVGLGIIFSFGVIPQSKMDHMMNEGIYLMGYVAFVMLVAAGFANVMKETGGVDALITMVTPFMTSKIIAVCLMLFVGLFITMGIGTSFGTIPILAVLYIPIFVKLGFSIPSMIITLAAAAALGDAGSPASDTTLGPTAGLNADNQHNHIWDTCVPTFVFYNIPIIIAAILAVIIFK